MTNHLDAMLLVVHPQTESAPEQVEQPGQALKWTRGVCPNCGYPKADVDRQGVLWCPACGYSKKGCYT